MRYVLNEGIYDIMMKKDQCRWNCKKILLTNSFKTCYIIIFLNGIFDGGPILQNGENRRSKLQLRKNVN